MQWLYFPLLIFRVDLEVLLIISLKAVEILNPLAEATMLGAEISSYLTEVKVAVNLYEPLTHEEKKNPEMSEILLHISLSLFFFFVRIPLLPNMLMVYMTKHMMLVVVTSNTRQSSGAAFSEMF